MDVVSQTLKGKRVLLGVTGSIAAYKAADLVRRLKAVGAEVVVMMTQAATKFITPLTLESLSDNRVAAELFPSDRRGGMHHISLAEWADLVLVAPATANVIGKVASGIADDLLTTVIMATVAPVCFAPAMNTNMFRNPVVSQNIRKLEDLGYKFISPEVGELACGAVGEGRLAEVGRIVDFVVDILCRSTELEGKTVLVTAGRTEEPIDPVRYISNYSTGKMGYALAEAARSRGAEVVLISGPSYLTPPWRVEVIHIQTAAEMAEQVFRNLPRTDVVIMAAAVADFRPKSQVHRKIKRAEQAELILELERNPDILQQVGQMKGDRIVVGFALETGDGVENAKRKLVEKNLNLIVLNDPTVEGAGFGTDTNVVTLIDERGKVEALPKLSKREVAERILDEVVRMIRTP